jgi:hypothetical protein
MAPRTVLPPRPLTLAASFVSKSWMRALLVGALGLAVVALVLGLAGWAAADILGQRSLSRSGTLAPYASISGKVKTTNIVYHEHDLTVSFQDEAGAMHSGKMEFSTLFLSADKELKPQVWYDPADPSRFALNLATERAGSRWLLVLFGVAIFGGIGVGILFAARSTLRALGDARKVAARSEELRVTITSVEEIRNQKGAPTGKRRWHWKGTAPGGAALAGSADFDKGHAPLYGDAAERTMVALYSPDAPKATIVLRDDLYPFAFDAAERERIRREATAPELGVG